MILLSIFDSKEAWWGGTIVFLVLLGWFIYNYVQIRKRGYIIDAKQGTGTGQITDPVKVKAKQNAFAFFYIPILTVAYIVFLFVLRSDYRPYNPKKDGIPQVQTDTTREAAEDMIKKQK